MKKITLLLLTGILAACLLAGCGKHDGGQETAEPAPQDTTENVPGKEEDTDGGSGDEGPDTSAEAVPEPGQGGTDQAAQIAEAEPEPEIIEDPVLEIDWKERYVSWMKSLMDESGSVGGRFSLLFIDEDDIPEIIWKTDIEAQGSLLVTYDGETLDELAVSRTGMTYLDSRNLVKDYSGEDQVMYDRIYSIRDGKWILQAEGSVEEKTAEDGASAGTGRTKPGSAVHKTVIIYTWQGQEVDGDTYDAKLSALFEPSETAVPTVFYDYSTMIGLLEDEEDPDADREAYAETVMDGIIGIRETDMDQPAAEECGPFTQGQIDAAALDAGVRADRERKGLRISQLNQKLEEMLAKNAGLSFYSIRMDSEGNGTAVYIQAPAAADEDGMTAALVLQTEDGGENWTAAADTVEMPAAESAGLDATAAEEAAGDQVSPEAPAEGTEEEPDQQAEPARQTEPENKQESGRQAEPEDQQAPGQEAQPRQEDGGSSPGNDRENV
jgi:hypothetical protein